MLLGKLLWMTYKSSPPPRPNPSWDWEKLAYFRSWKIWHSSPGGNWGELSYVVLGTIPKCLVENSFILQFVQPLSHITTGLLWTTLPVHSYILYCFAVAQCSSHNPRKLRDGLLLPNILFPCYAVNKNSEMTLWLPFSMATILLWKIYFFFSVSRTVMFDWWGRLAVRTL